MDSWLLGIIYSWQYTDYNMFRHGYLTHSFIWPALAIAAALDRLQISHLYINNGICHCGIHYFQLGTPAQFLYSQKTHHYFSNPSWCTPYSSLYFFQSPNVHHYNHYFDPYPIQLPRDHLTSSLVPHRPRSSLPSSSPIVFQFPPAQHITHSMIVGS